jgi:hypothetical protein
MDKNRNLEKQKASINSGYKFMFLIDKNYTDLEKIISKNGYSFI